MDEIDLALLDDDDFVFEPTAWDLAMAIGIGPDPEADPARLDELADAMLVWAQGPELERLTDEAIERIWDAELEQLIRDGLVRLLDKDDWRAGAQAALDEFDRDGRDAEVSREVVRCIATYLGDGELPLFFCLCCIDEGVQNAHEDRRRQLALPVALVARGDAAISDAELRAALGAPAPIEQLGTEKRRRAVRVRLGRLGELGRESMPVLAAELRALAAEPLPACAADDDVWEHLCTWLLADVAKPELN